MIQQYLFEQIEASHPDLPEVITPSIGYPTLEKVQQVVETYKRDDRRLIGCFLDQKLLGVIGVELSCLEVTIKHISVLENFRLQGIGKQLIQYAMNYFSMDTFLAETDRESVGFYRGLGFECFAVNGKQGPRRYTCRYGKKAKG